MLICESVNPEKNPLGCCRLPFAASGYRVLKDTLCKFKVSKGSFGNQKAEVSKALECLLTNCYYVNKGFVQKRSSKFGQL